MPLYAPSCKGVLTLTHGDQLVANPQHERPGPQMSGRSGGLGFLIDAAGFRAHRTFQRGACRGPVGRARVVMERLSGGAPNRHALATRLATHLAPRTDDSIGGGLAPLRPRDRGEPDRKSVV